MHSFALIALGANQPESESERVLRLREAADRIALELSDEGGVRRSGLYRTPAYPVGIGSDFVNACLAVPCRHNPEDVLRILHEIEAEAGRERGERWGERPLDLDLLAFGDAVLPDVTVQTRWRALSSKEQRETAPDRLILPHPRVQDRAFVLVPLSEVAPEWIHPVLGLGVARMLSDLGPGALAGIERIGTL